MTVPIAPARSRKMPPRVLVTLHTEPAAAYGTDDHAAVGGVDRQRVPVPEAFVLLRDGDRRAPAWYPALYPFAGGTGALLTGGGATGFAFFGFFAFLGFVSPMVALPLRAAHPTERF